MRLGKLFKSLFQSKTDVFARYEVLRRAISGTMSKFYQVRDRETQEIFGLKVLDKEKTAAFRARLRGLDRAPEGEIAMAIEHPHIVKTYEHGMTVDDEQYLLMEYVEGPGMHALVAARSRHLEGRRLPLIRQAAEALGAVHEAGYIHRDVCPRNFVVSPDTSSLKLIDFGLSVPATPDFMQPGNRTGTAAYMSPEVVRRKPTDQRLDIFSFGVTAYELCALELPWQGGTDGRAALSHDVVAPTPIEQYCPNIDPRFAQAIMQCLVTDRNERPASMEEFLRMIERVEQEDRE